MRGLRRLALFLAVCALAMPSARQAPADLVIDKNVEATMRDGVVLRADVYRPPGPGRRPALLQGTPYSKNPAAADSHPPGRG